MTNAKWWQFSSSDNLGYTSLKVNEERQQTSNHVKKKKDNPTLVMWTNKKNTT